jgi:deazaflavin-dependent oxidoreductase (nitroreductase family)
MFAARVFNPLAMRFGISGAHTLAVAGRRTGKVHRVPVIPVEVDGATYIVSPRGESHWVRNLRATGGVGDLSGKEGSAHFQAAEIPVEERAPILEAYRRKAGRAVESHFKALPDPQDHPVFRITRT